MLARLRPCRVPRAPFREALSVLWRGPLRCKTTDVPEEAVDKRYIDRLVVTAQAGAGGNGSASCIQKSNRGRKITADGGNGGGGGDVIVRATSKMKSLAGVAQLYKARNGVHGTSKAQHGCRGADVVVLVPLGTVVSRIMEDDEAAGAAAGQEGSVVESGSGSFDAAARQRSPGTKKTAPGQSSQETPTGSGATDSTLDNETLDLPDWILRWRKAYGVDAVDLDARDSFAEQSSDTKHGRQSRMFDAELEDEEGEAASASAATPRRRRGPRQFPTTVLADLTKEGQEVLVAAGGKGGIGNAAMKAMPNRPAPREAVPGTPGDRKRLLLEMKTMADIGLVGIPNAGKSSLLRALTSARPKVGSYAFTTLMPQLGVVDLGHGERMVLADVPGLIAGAARDRGLGHAFLRHIERTRALAYVLDASAGLHGLPGLRPWKQLELLQEEIEAYSPELAALPAVVIANKIDLLPRPARTVCAIKARTELPVLAVSAVEGQGIPGLTQALTSLWAGEPVEGGNGGGASEGTACKASA